MTDEIDSCKRAKHMETLETQGLPYEITLWSGTGQVKADIQILPEQMQTLPEFFLPI